MMAAKAKSTSAKGEATPDAPEVVDGTVAELDADVLVLVREDEPVAVIC